jgi:hypothetical protein
MNLDVRTPAGIMFVILGAVLTIYGLVSDPSLYQRSLGINVNLVWGVIMAVFGVALLWWQRRSPAQLRAPDSRGEQ